LNLRVLIRTLIYPIALLVIAGILMLQSACQSINESNPIVLEQSLPVTLRDMDDEYAAAKRANLSFYSPRYFINLENAYQKIARLRHQLGQQAGQSPEIHNYLTIFKHNLARAYVTKSLVQQRMGSLLVDYLRLENSEAYQQHPEKLEELDQLLTKCLKILELRQIDSVSWDQLQADKFNNLRDQFESKLELLQHKS